MDSRSPRDGRVIEELGTYDPMIKETDARVRLDAERVDYWIGVGAQPTPKVGVLIKKYGKDGTHLEQQAAALERLKASKPQAPPPVAVPKPKPAEPAASEAAAPAAEEQAPEDAAPAVEATEGGEAATEEKTEPSSE